MQGTGREVFEGQWQYCLRLFHQWNSQWCDDDLRDMGERGGSESSHGF